MRPEEFGPFFAEQRKNHNLTQKQLAEKLHVSPAAVSKWERSLCLPEMSKLESISEVFGLSLMEVMQCRINGDSPYAVDEVQKALSDTIRISSDEKRKNRIKLFALRLGIIAAVALALVAAYKLYSRPMTISQLYPMLSVQNCTGVQGYYEQGVMAEATPFRVERSDERFALLWDMFNRREYRRRISDLFPRRTKIHAVHDGNFWWDVSFRFEDIQVYDDAIGSASLRFHDFYGELEIDFVGDTYCCFTDGQDEWLKTVFDAIRE